MSIETRAPLPGRPMSWQANQYRTIYIDYDGRLRKHTIEAEFYDAMYDQGQGYVNLCCPLCQKGMEDIPTEAQGDALARTLTIRREHKYFEVDEQGRLTVREPITCSYCQMWSVRITRGVAHDSI